MKRFSVFLQCCASVLILFAATATAQQPARRLMTVADTLRIANVSDAQISPDGQWVAYTVTTNADDARTRTTVWLARTSVEITANASGRAPAPLLPEGWTASQPRWSPDSRRIAFLSSRENQIGIWAVSLDNRTPRFIAAVRSTNFHIAYAGESLAWSPDSRRIAFISASEVPDESASNTQNDDARRNDPRVINRIQYRSRTGFADNLRTHVWVTDVENPQPRQLTSGRNYDHALTWNPQGNEIAFLSNHEPDPDANNNSDIFAVNMEGRVRRITETRGSEYEPAWSPDGRFIAYTATKRDVTTIDSIAEDAHVWVIDARGGSAGRELTAALDRRTRSPRWSADSRAIYFLANTHGKTFIYRSGVEGGEALRIGIVVVYPRHPCGGLIISNHYQINHFTLASVSETISGVENFPRMAFVSTDAFRPAEIFVRQTGVVVAEPGTVVASRVSRQNDTLRDALQLAEPEEINFNSFDGTPIQGWLLRPANFREGERYPLILSVHGGPHGMYGWGFNSTFQVYAARGYAVLYLNPRGSSGYGQRFSDGTLREWGGGDYRDLMAGVDHVLNRYPWIDRERLGVTGGSYGGFMTNWIVTQTPRFKAAVSSASVSNLISFYGTSLYQDLIHAEFGGFPWDDYETLWRWSPLRYVNAVQTPVLFIHGEQDYDVPLAQAEEMYQSLRRRGINTELVIYPREGHGLREPRHRADALERTVSWFDRFLRR
jgi:dipeptidyl aminopeptidase/acylaminoacyl peptidase